MRRTGTGMNDWRQDAAKARYVILGPTGWIGQAAMAWLASVIGHSWRDKVTCFGSSARAVSGPGGDIQVRDLKTLQAKDVEDAIVLHLSYLTKDKTASMSDADFFAANLGIDEVVLSALRGAHPRGVFVASSGAARDVAIGASRNLYGVTKLLQEERFETWARESGLTVLTGRIFNIAGPHINKLELYAISSFALQGLTTGRIRVDASLPVFRSFLHVRNLLEIVVAELLNGEPSKAAIDLCGAEILEMGQIAEAVARELGLSVSAIERGVIDYGRSSAYLGDPRATLTLAMKHRVTLASFLDQVRDTVAAVHFVQRQS